MHSKGKVLKLLIVLLRQTEVILHVTLVLSLYRYQASNISQPRLPGTTSNSSHRCFFFFQVYNPTHDIHREENNRTNICDAN